MRLTRTLFPLLIALLAYVPATLGSHVSGIDITYSCIGPNQFEIFLNLYRDCSGISMSQSETVDIVSDCGQSFTLNLSQASVSGFEISQLCDADIPNSTCNGGTLPGMEQYIYTGVVNLTPPCDSWTISWSTCCRNPSNNVPTSGSDDIYGEAVINTVTAPCNNSPQFTAQPIPYYCVNQQVNFNYGVFDPDGDSLVYELIDARSGPANFLAYGAGFSATSPIPGLTLNTQTGEMNFTPTMNGQYIVVVQVSEYDAAGNLIGTVMRDMQFAIITCTNTVPPPPNSMANFTGNASQTGPFSVAMCLGNQFCFDVTFTDPDIGDSLTLTSNVASVLPGATFTQFGINPATATICWNAVAGTATLASFVVTADDNACPTPGLTPQTFTVELPPGVQVVPDDTLCSPQTVTLNSTGGGNLTWTVLSGDPIVVGSNFSCDTCHDPLATPAVTTTYILESDLSTTCINQDTVTINVVEPFDFASLQIRNVVCHGESSAWVKVNPTGLAGPPWTYELYDMGGGLLNSVTSNTSDTLSGIAVGTYTVHLVEPFGCYHDTTITIVEPDPMTIATDDSTVCQTTSAVLSAYATGGNGGYSFVWDHGLIGNGPHVVSPDSVTDYLVYAQDNQGCTSLVDTATVQLYPFLSMVTSAPDSICRYNAAFLAATGSGGEGSNYQYMWEELGDTLTLHSDTATVVPNSGSTLYAVIMTDVCGSPAVHDTLEVAWYAPPATKFSSTVREDCVPAELEFFNNTPLIDVGNTCIWDFGDGTVIAGGCQSITHSYDLVGCYDVNLKVYDPAGCPGDTTLIQYVCARPYPEADFEFGPTYSNVFDTEIMFNNLSVDGVSYEWFFGDGGMVGHSEEEDPVMIFPDEDEGKYTTWLYTTNEFGCVDSVEKAVTINGVYSFYIPTAFTPDGNGVNEFFGPIGEGISTEQFQMLVFDRGGQQIYNTTDREQPWDGTIGGNGGTQAMTGVYNWIIQAIDKYSGIRKEYRGHVTLLR